MERLSAGRWRATLKSEAAESPPHGRCRRAGQAGARFLLRTAIRRRRNSEAPPPVRFDISPLRWSRGLCCPAYHSASAGRSAPAAADCGGHPTTLPARQPRHGSADAAGSGERSAVARIHHTQYVPVLCFRSVPMQPRVLTKVPANNSGPCQHGRSPATVPGNEDQDRQGVRASLT